MRGSKGNVSVWISESESGTGPSVVEGAGEVGDAGALALGRRGDAAIPVADVDLAGLTNGDAAFAVVEVELPLRAAPSRRRSGGGAGRRYDDGTLAAPGKPCEVVEAGTALEVHPVLASS